MVHMNVAPWNFPNDFTYDISFDLYIVPGEVGISRAISE